MTFSETDKIKAMAIVSAFETGKPTGDFSAVAVLNDGAGISYGFHQFTHRSGALAAVLEVYLASGGHIARSAIENALLTAHQRSASAIRALAADARFKNALRAAATTTEMKHAQIDTAISCYLEPAVLECERFGFSQPLSLAVVYDSITHGSWERFRDSASRAVGESATAFERVWIAEYIRQRDRWLASVPRLATTRYRTRFFLNQIKAGNWQLTPPFSAQGVRITNKTISQIETLLRGPLARVDGPAAESEPANDPTSRASHPISPAQDPHEPLLETQPPVSEAETGTLTSVSEINNETCLDEVENEVNSLAAKYDQIERIATTITTRNDAAKSLWTTVVGSVTQTFWALFGLMAGIPREVWLVVAIVAAALMLMYLYRQITLGKIRERKQADSTV